MGDRKLRIASFFTGVGGIDLGFEQTGFCKTIYANEIDKSPTTTFEMNFDIKVDMRDISNVKVEEIPTFDIMLAGFPCQAFSIAGLRQGFEDEKGRGTLFFELIRILKYHKPQIVFLENVKNLATHDNGNTFTVILDELNKLGYHTKYSVLNAMEHGNVPQNRERIYIVGFLNKEICEKFKFPNKMPLTNKLSDIIDFETKIDDKYYYTKDKYKGDIYEKLTDAMDDENAIYQWRRKYVRKNKSGVVPTLTANQGEGGHNVCLIKTKHGIRKMTPQECFNAQGFPKTYILPTSLPDSKLYKQAGNSVCVSVIYRIAKNIIDAHNLSN